MTNIKRKRLRYAAAGVALSLGLAGAATGQTVDPTQGLLNDPTPEAALVLLQNAAKYPPDTTPLQPYNWDLLHPWTVDTPSLPMIPATVQKHLDSLQASGLSEEAAIQAVAPASFPMYQFSVNKLIVTGPNDEFVARLTASAPTGSNATAPHYHIVSTQLIGDDVFGSPILDGVHVFCMNPGGACAFHWKAPSEDKKYWGALELVVTLAVDGVTDNFVVRQGFYSSPMVAGTFTGGFQERLENGSLLIEAGVTVNRRMACFVSANLYSADKEVPTHHVERRMIVDPAMKTITFTFFGKVFRDYGNAGTFRLQDLKGQCENLTYPPEWFIDEATYTAELSNEETNPSTVREPTRIYFTYNNFTYNTLSYQNNVFSASEWQSPERTSKLELMKLAMKGMSDPAIATRKQQQLNVQPLEVPQAVK